MCCEREKEKFWKEGFAWANYTPGCLLICGWEQPGIGKLPPGTVNNSLTPYYLPDFHAYCYLSKSISDHKIGRLRVKSEWMKFYEWRRSSYSDLGTMTGEDCPESVHADIRTGAAACSHRQDEGLLKKALEVISEEQLHQTSCRSSRCVIFIYVYLCHEFTQFLHALLFPLLF